MKLDNATVLITGANRGIGLAFAREALARGARKVYAGARDPASVTLPGVEAIQLDVTRAEHVAAAARHCSDVTLLINNAGIAAFGGFLAEGSIDSARAHLETNFFGPLRLSQAFAPLLAAYGASKSAAWALTNGLRHELRAQGTQVLGMHVGFVDTDLTRGIDLPKSAPEVIVRRTLDALEAGAEEVLADERAQQIKQGLLAEPSIYLRDPRS